MSTTCTTTVKETFAGDTLTRTTTETKTTEVVTVTPPPPTRATTPPPPAPILDKTYYYITAGVLKRGDGCFHSNKLCQGRRVGERMGAHAISDIKTMGNIRACLKCVVVS